MPIQENHSYIVELICLFFVSIFIQYNISNPFLSHQIHRQMIVKQKGEGLQELFQ